MISAHGHEDKNVIDVDDPPVSAYELVLAYGGHLLLRRDYENE
jgi:hypothetical protein